MTNELEKQFFQCFGIEPREFKSCDVGTFCPYPEKECGTDTCPYYRTYKVDYPAISDRILLELICIDNQENIYKCRPPVDNVEKLKTYILEEFIRLYELGLFKRAQQVRTLFEEG